MSTPYLIILFNSKDEFEYSSATVEIPTSPSNMSISDDEKKPFEYEPMETEENEMNPSPRTTHLKRNLRKTNMKNHSLPLNMPPRRQPLSSSAIEQLIAQRVADEIIAHKTNKNNRVGINDGPGASDTAGGVENITRGCSYKELLNCNPRSFNGTKGAVG
nr:hypothetical protein [Tanacetum cinerariifolium]